jgi:hypothetical protein
MIENKIQGRPTLNEIGIKYNTDKASVARRQDGSECIGHNYLGFYEQFFSEFRDQKIKVLELGVGPEWRSGASLFAFREYFSSGEVIGADIRATSASVAGERIRIEIGDLGEVGFLEQLRTIEPMILIDDASHFWHHQVLAVCELWQSVQKGGIYVCEDIHTSFGKFKVAGQHSGGQTFTAFRFLQIISELKQDPKLEFPEIPLELVEKARIVSRECAFVAFARHTVLLKKKS